VHSQSTDVGAVLHNFVNTRHKLASLDFHGKELT
jgi:hypothetical protein